MAPEYWDDFPVGSRKVTAARTITVSDIVNFASISGDYHPLHMDDEYSKASIFGGRVAHGPLVYAVAVGLVGSSGLFGNSLIAFLGINNLRHTGPVQPGDTIHVETEVLKQEASKKPDRGVTVFQYDVKKHGGETVMIAEMSFLMRRKA